jgi:outer membrane protein OmpA-like peptidoglycan-associated protein
MYWLALILAAGLAVTGAVMVRPDFVDVVLRTGASSLKKAAEIYQPPRGEPSEAAAVKADKGNKPLSTFDVVRIDPQGASVFAGQAPPNANVRIQSDGQVVASATADETGAWAIVTEHKFAPGEYTLSLGVEPGQHQGISEDQTVRVVVAPTTSRASDAPTVPLTPPQAKSAPITFLYNETTFTGEGRQAAVDLAQQLIAQHSDFVSLSGHADERGSDLYNMELSRRRLLVVADFLRDSGYTGKFELIPKGKSEPYRGIDRQALAREDAFQFDRRVELLQVR